MHFGALEWFINLRNEYIQLNPVRREYFVMTMN